MGLLSFEERRGPGWFLALRTTRADGSAVLTPVWAAQVDGDWYVCTPSRSGKARRIRSEPRVDVADADFSGAALSAWTPATARIVDGAEARRGRRALWSKYRLQFLIFRAATAAGRRRRYGGPPVIIAIHRAQ